MNQQLRYRAFHRSLVNPLRQPLQTAIAMFAAAAVWTTAPAVGQTTDFTFSEPIVVQLTSGHNPSDVAAGDLNGNGNLDLVVPGRNNDGIVSVLLGNGDGTFAAPQSFNAASQTDQAVLADFNGDGNLDLALTLRSFVGRVAIYFGNGDGTFSEEPDYYVVGRLSQALAGGDLNNNGHVDLVVGLNRGGTIRVLLNNGDGTFALQEPIFIEEFVAGLSLIAQITVGDINSNGALDLSVTSLGTGRFTVLFNDGLGNFAADRSYRLPVHNETTTASSVTAITDVTGDGQNDIVSTMVVGLSERDRIAVFTSDGDGVFDPPVSFEANTAGLLFSMAMADFDGDGRPDVVVGTGLDSQLAFMKNTSTAGNVSFLAPKTITAFVGLAYQLRPMDVNNNGVIDLVYPDISGDAVKILLNTTPQGAAGSSYLTRAVEQPDAGRSTDAPATPAVQSSRDLRGLLNITDADSVQDILIKLDSMGDAPRKESR